MRNQTAHGIESEDYRGTTKTFRLRGCVYWRNCSPNIAQWLNKTVHGENKGVMMERAKSDLIATCERRKGSSDIGAFVPSFIAKLLFAHIRG